jgi:outer membrane immunogenic protein
MSRKFILGAALAAFLPSTVLAADLPVMVEAAIPVAIYNWTGFYAGGHIGGRWAEHNDRMFIGPTGTTITGTETSSLVGGLQAGYNWQLNPSTLVGVEVDVSYGRNEASLTGTSNLAGPVLQFPGPLDGFFRLSSNTAFTQSMTSEIDWTGSLRARLGFTNDRLLVFVTGGLALGHIEVNLTQTANTTATLQLFRPPGATLVATATTDAGTTVLSGRRSQIRAGWTLGGGVEYALDQSWLVRGEYLYADYGRVSVGLSDGSSASARIQTHTLRAALNYRF